MYNGARQPTEFVLSHETVRMRMKEVFSTFVLLTAIKNGHLLRRPFLKVQRRCRQKPLCFGLYRAVEYLHVICHGI